MIVCLGEAIVDLICERELSEFGEADRFAPHPGGALANVAVAASREGASAGLLGGVGDDPWGSWLRERLWHERVDVSSLETVAGLMTPVAFVTFDWEREPSFSVYGEGIGETMAAAAGHLDEAIAGPSTSARNGSQSSEWVGFPCRKTVGVPSPSTRR